MNVIDRYTRLGFTPTFVNNFHGFEVVIYHKYREDPAGWLIITDCKLELLGSNDYHAWVNKHIKALMEREGIENAQIN